MTDKQEPKRGSVRPAIEARGALSVGEAIDYLNVGRTKIYAEMQSGRLPYRKIGRKTLILKAEADAYLQALPTGLGSPGGEQRHKDEPSAPETHA
ncbi:helix-turn-helix domain-containing protein [Rhizobium ruizarguesonis]|uniref:DNA-binding protein n=1 Tax=Rhizobium ruizarguesonis TaxID=2081791 RepID=A0AAE8QBU6_9HYPH|nr:helix-turn-helix domain-containing protein [Rhizobium ruizarguesonis]QIJ39592.1 helix-turn-helix domain-containing protein [Rhizobium leguminosarum]TBF17807.1 DNA-binding protein [Rhizobium ruizarguesonis]